MTGFWYAMDDVLRGGDDVGTAVPNTCTAQMDIALYGLSAKKPLWLVSCTTTKRPVTTHGAVRNAGTSDPSVGRA